ncbi:hypothetical protein B0T22DRAFT_438149 [Podospora appendiculata]|uniref:Uncharacterized protein n=1 Tax=Podospora appendiculata TaxID=314037 RepID=A0AAE0XKI0_9PEZI|nr:hypothetical protein B0T22DRAFT_438149 [Podospora appendiculata]
MPMPSQLYTVGPVCLALCPSPDLGYGASQSSKQKHASPQQEQTLDPGAEAFVKDANSTSVNKAAGSQGRAAPSDWVVKLSRVPHAQRPMAAADYDGTRRKNCQTKAGGWSGGQGRSSSRSRPIQQQVTQQAGRSCYLG